MDGSPGETDHQKMAVDPCSSGRETALAYLGIYVSWVEAPSRHGTYVVGVSERRYRGPASCVAVGRRLLSISPPQDADHSVGDVLRCPRRAGAVAPGSGGGECGCEGITGMTPPCLGRGAGRGVGSNGCGMRRFGGLICTCVVVVVVVVGVPGMLLSDCTAWLERK